MNVLKHNRVPTPVEHQPVIRMNRDTLYSVAVADISEGATVTIPDGGDRYVSVMVVNQDHYINRTFHRPGEHRLTIEEFDTPWVVVGARILVDPGDDDDVAAVNALQDAFKLAATSSKPFEVPEYDVASLDATRKALLELAKGMTSFDHAFGARADVDPVHHLLGTAAGWGGLPDRGGGLHQLRAGQAGRRVLADHQGRPRRWLLVDLALQRRRLLRTERPQRLQRQQPHGETEPRRIRDRALRRLWGRPAELPPDHGGMELHGSPVPPPSRGARRLLELPDH